MRPTCVTPRRRSLACLALAALVLLPAAARAAERPAVSVLYFENRTGRADYDVLRKGLADMIVTDLAAWDGVTVVERERLEAVLGELKLQQTRAFDAAKRQRIGKLLGAQYILVGSMNLAGPTLALDAQLIEVQSGVVKVAARASGAPDRVFELEQELVTKITAAIDARLKDPGLRRAAKVPDLKALMDYSRAVDLADQGRYDEANAAMRRLVSSAPTFLMARDRQARILRELEAHGKRRVELVSNALVALGETVDLALKREAGFDRLDAAGQLRFLGLRILRGRLLNRLLRQHLSTHEEHLKLVRRGEEAKALAMMRVWVENQRRLLGEAERFHQQHATGWHRIQLDDDLARRVRDAQIKEPDLNEDFAMALVRFVLQGSVADGEHHYTVGPALGDLDPREAHAAFELIARRVTRDLAEHARTPVAQQRRYESTVTQYLEEQANAQLRLDQDEAAAASLQRILDAFPTGYRAPWIENRIKQIAGAGHDHERSLRERWAQALKTCNDMDIRVGEGTLHRKLVRFGLAALALQAGELEKACKPSPKNRSAFAYLYGSLAHTAVAHEDCAGYRAWSRKYLEAGGSASDMLAFQKRTPWCELGDVTKSVVWMTATYDELWSFDLGRNLTSVRSHDRKVLSLFGAKEGGRMSFALYLDATGPDTFRCRLAQWTMSDGEKLEGPCAVALTRLARELGEYDEGTFTADFQTTGPGGRPRTIKVTKGGFRLRRH